ncbi:hypothetical protein GCM10010387_50210 [Streptomyces inusitatus]|uniref:Uncharacterized protein n=1 Tax=Streptomyces inusitatus TaxID=68221 RepID=A0A918QJZ9_9ACTN|nr:hypothetical protein [Streptomyces inusitatus]GGZ49876.1 hypothetical protein GCM10010387_50210 [Streptomyces inusitatus]
MLSKQSSRQPNRTLVLILTTVLMTFGIGLTVTPEAEAYAVSCSQSHAGNGEGGGRLKTDVNLKRGPYTHCANAGTAASGELVYYHCYVLNDYGNVFWYVRVAGTSNYGWTSAANIEDIYIDDNGDGIRHLLYC